MNALTKDSVLISSQKMQESEELSLNIQEEALKAVQSIKKGRVLLYPSDTLWGLGCDITNQSAVARIYEIKQRDPKKPFILLVNSIQMLKRYIVMIHPRVETLLMHHVQPLTLIYQSNGQLPSYIVPEDETVAIRVTKDPFCRAVITQLNQPLISTSANSAGSKTPITFDEIEDRILEMTDDIADRRLEKNNTGQPSVIGTFNHKGELDFIRD